MICLEYKKHREIRKDIEPLFVSAFPSNERPTPDIYFDGFDHSDNILYGFYEDDKFIGFSSLVFFEDIAYIFFLAVNDNYRHQGYGSKILSMIKDMYHDYVILLCYEEVDPKYDDYDLRKKREQFYLKNGFISNDIKTNEFGVIFQTAYYGKHKVSFKQYQQIFLKGFGEWCLKHLKEYQN